MSFVDGENGFDFPRLDVGEEEYEEGLTLDDIKKVLPKLAPSYKRAIEMYYIDGLKHDDIAEKLGITTSTSKTNLMKAKSKLKDLLSDIYRG